MRPHGKTKLGFFPLPVPEAKRLRSCLVTDAEFSALDPCVGDGVAFVQLVEGMHTRRYGVEIDAYRTEQARNLGIETVQASAFDVRTPAEAFSLLYLNPPYDLEIGATNNQRLELVFLEHTYRWLNPGGVLVFIIPQPQLRACERILSEIFADLSVYRLTEPASVQYKQIAVLGVRRKRHQHVRDSVVLDSVRWLEHLAVKPDLEPLGRRHPSAMKFPLQVPSRSFTREFHSMKSKIFCSSLGPIGKRAASFYRSSGMFADGRSPLCMAATLDCSVRQECSTGSSAKEKIAISLIGVR